MQGNDLESDPKGGIGLFAATERNELAAQGSRSFGILKIVKLNRD